LKKRPSKSLGFLHENVVEKSFFNTLLRRKRGHDIGSVLWPGGKMPPDTAGKDARRYRSTASAR
jgi:hypothetical protein